MKTQIDLTQDAWTIASYLESAAVKFEEIERSLCTPDAQFNGFNTNLTAFASTFASQAKDARRLAQAFKDAETVTLS
jgi:hypothetical protein